MIVIFSYSGDAGTTPVLKWLDHFSVPYVRVNLEEEDYSGISLKMKNSKTQLTFTQKNGNVIDWETVAYSFYRGGVLSLNNSTHLSDQKGNDYIFEKYTFLEYSSLTSFFYEEVSKKCLGNLIISNNPLNKLSQLSEANKCGMNIPETFISADMEWVKLQAKNKKELITKAIQETIFEENNEGSFLELKSNLVQPESLEGKYFPSLFQESVDKKLEVRTFVLEDQFYSLGMYVPNTLKQSVDFRSNVDNLRFFKHELPEKLKAKIINFMNRLNLNTGSFDFLVDRNDRYIFLEVNPTGQYDWVSACGLYDIEKQIALFLKKKHDEYSQ
jgi:hypothetical protein